MQGSDDAVHIGVDRAARRAVKLRQRRVPKDSTFHERHHEERRADHGRVVAIAEHLRDRHIGVCQRLHHAVLPIDRMRRRQQLARRLLAQHVALRSGIGDEIGRVRLAVAEALGAHRQRETVDAAGQPVAERVGVEVPAGRAHGDALQSVMRRPLAASPVSSFDGVQ